jgi:hypothetical protein
MSRDVQEKNNFLFFIQGVVLTTPIKKPQEKFLRFFGSSASPELLYSI